MSKDNIISKHGDHDRNRMFPDVKGPSPHGFKSRKDCALERLKFWSAMSTKEQIMALDSRLGKGEGAKKQRARLMARLEQGKHKVIETAPVQAEPVRLKAKDRRAAEQARSKRAPR